IQDPPPANLTRMYFISEVEGALGRTDIMVTDRTDGWKQRAEDLVSHPVGLVRDPVVEDFESPAVSEGVQAIRYQEDGDGAVTAIQLLAGIQGTKLITLRAETRNIAAFAQMRAEMNNLFATIETRKA